MINNVISINKQGLSHEQCEDRIYEDKINSVFVVCDGVSNSLYGGEGAKALSAYIGKAIANEQTKKHLAVDNVSYVRDTMVKLISKSSELTIKKLGCELRDISTTMIVVSVWDDIVTVIHAGDGAVFASPEVYQDEVPLIVSYPDNDAEQKVFPAASPRQLERMRVIRLKTSDIKCLVFGTDGFTDAYLRPEKMGFDGYGLHELCKIETNEELENIVKRKHLSKRPIITDDISAIILKFDNDIEYDGMGKVKPVEEITEDFNKIPIKNKENKQVDNTSPESASIPESNKVLDADRIKKAVLIILSVLVICCMAAVCVFGNNIKAVNENHGQQISNMSEEISSLHSRVDGLEKTMTEEESTTSNSKNTTSRDDEVTDTTENTTDDEQKSQNEMSNVVTTGQQSETLANYTRY